MTDNAARVGLDLGYIALFASIPILAGAALQIPVGIASDKFDRRVVLVWIGFLALVADALFLFGNFTNPLTVMIVSALFGATVFAMYPIIVAHASDHAAPGSFIQVSGGLLLIFGIGSIIGPTIAGVTMTTLGTASLFGVTGTAHLLLVIFAFLRIKTSAPVSIENKSNFKPQPMGRVSTPETAALAADETELYADRQAFSATKSNEKR